MLVTVVKSGMNLSKTYFFMKSLVRKQMKQY